MSRIVAARGRALARQFARPPWTGNRTGQTGADRNRPSPDQCLSGRFPDLRTTFSGRRRSLGIDEDTLIARIDALLKAGVLTRFGPLFNADRMGGVNVLAAMAVPNANSSGWPSSSICNRRSRTTIGANMR
jgi:hypothetical protein